jgi:hypothetical protein
MKASRRWWPFAVVAALSLAGVLATLAIARPLQSGTRIVHYGYPLWFVEAETTLTPPEGWKGTVQLNPWEYPTETNVGRLVVSWLVVAALPLTGVWWYERRRERPLVEKSEA